MTLPEYQRLCDRLAQEAIRFAKRMSTDEDADNIAVACPKCERAIGEPCKFPVWASGSGHDAPKGFVHNERGRKALDAQREHWIDVFLDEHLPDIDDGTLLEMTRHPKAFEENAGHPAPSREVAAFHALQADVWDVINRAKESA